MNKKTLLKGLWVLLPVLAAATAMGIYSALPRDRAFVLEGAVEIAAEDCYVQAGGTVESVLVQTGQQVRAGDVLARLDDGDIDSRADQLRQTMAIQQTQLDRLLSPPDTAALEAARQAALDTAAMWQENLTQAQRVLSNAQQDLADQQALYDAGAIARVELEQYQRAAEAAQTQVSVTQAQLSAARNSADAIQVPTVDEHAVAAAQAELQLTQLQLDELERTREKYLVTAPEDGVVIRSHLSPGATVMPGQSAFRLSRGGDQYFVFYLPQDYLDQIAFGDQLTLWRANDQEETGRATVCYIDWQAVYPPENYENSGNKNQKSVQMKAVIDSGGPFQVGETLVLRLQTGGEN